MERIVSTQGTSITRMIEVEPDRLIELGHRLKQAAMESCQRGESVTVPFTTSITLVYHPEREFCKPNHKYGSIGTYGTAFYVEDFNGAYPV